MTHQRAEWSKPTIILAVLTLLANLGWALFGMSQKATGDMENRLRTVETTVATLSANLTSLTATMIERGNRRDIAIDDLNARMRDEERRR